MSTTPLSTKPDDQRRTEQEPPRREEPPARESASASEPLEQAAAVHPSDRAVDADLLLDIPQLAVEQLTLELDAALVLNSVRLDAKGLETGVYLKADLDLLRMLVQKNMEGPQRQPAAGARGSSTRHREATGVLRELLDFSRSAYRDLSERRAPQQLGQGDAPQSEGTDAGGHEKPDDGEATLDRARHVAKEGVKAAGMTAAGLAGGALLESRLKPTRKLPLPRRRNRAQAIGHEIVKRLP